MTNTAISDDPADQSYAYDHAGRRVTKTVAGPNAYTAQNVYDGDDILAQYRTGWTSPTSLYTHGPGVDDPLMVQEPAQQAKYFHADGLGSIVLQSSALQDSNFNAYTLQRYHPWGWVTDTTESTPMLGFTGREDDGTGLMYYRARYYYPGFYRFTQRDPIGLAGGINPYAYVGNNPVNYTDPSGLVRWDDAIKSGVNLVSNGAGVFVGAVLTSAGAGLFAAPEPVLTKLAGAGAVAFGTTIYAKSVAGTAMSFNNLIDAIQDRPVSMPGSAAEWVAGQIAPGNSTAQKSAQIFDLGLDLASGRVNPAKMIVLKPGEGIPRLKWGTAAETIERSYGSSGKAFNTASDGFQGFAAAGSLYDSGKDISGSLNLNSYFGNLQGAGGSGNQTLSGVSPKN